MSEVNENGIADQASPAEGQPLGKENGQAQNRGILFRIGSSVDLFMKKFFFRLGLFVSKNPIKVIIASIIFMVITLVGMLRFRSESRAEKLWVPQNTVAISNQAYVNSFYGRSSRFAAYAFTSKDAEGGLANRESLLEISRLVEEGSKVTAGPIEGEGSDNTLITWQERCLKTQDSKGNEFCRTSSPLNLFYDPNSIVKNPDGSANFYATVRSKLNGLSEKEIKNTLENPPEGIFDRSPFNKEQLYAGESGKGESFDVKVISYYQFIENNAIASNGNLVDVEADALEEKWTNFVSGNGSSLLKTTNVFVNSDWGQSKSLGQALTGDLPLLSFGFILLGIYVTFFLGDFHAIRSHMSLGIGALLTTGLSLGSCFGLSSLTGMFFGPVHQILPLLIIGIGIDDCFHITRAADDVNMRSSYENKPVESKIALALSSSGSAITVTSFTNVTVFLLSSISRLPALRFFSLWAAIGIFFAWVYSITFYTALVTLDLRRIGGNRRDCIPCFRVREPKELNYFKKKAGGFSRFFKDSYGPFILRPTVRLVFLILFILGLGASIYGSSQLYLKFNFSFFYPSGSLQREYQDVIDEYYELGDSTFVYVRNTSLKLEANRRKFLDLCDPESGVVANNKWIQKITVDCWYANLRKTLDIPDKQFASPEAFITDVKAMLNSGAGARYNSSIIFSEDGSDIVSTRFSANYIYRPNNTAEIRSLQSVRDAASSVGFGDAEGNPAAFPYTFIDTFSEQYAALPTEIGLSLGLACLAVGIVCILLVGHPIVALISLLVVGMIILSVLGLTFFADVQLNSVSVITLVLCTGISVDFVVHITRSFMEQVGDRTERSIKALATMGPPVFYAGFSTFLAIIILAGAKSYIFQVIFKGFVFLISMAFLHGLILGPILLSYFGPPSFYASEEEKSIAEAQLEGIVAGQD